MPPPGTMRVRVRVMGERRAPGVEDAGQADAGAEMLGVCGDAQERLGGVLERDAIDLRLVLLGDVGDLRR